MSVPMCRGINRKATADKSPEAAARDKPRVPPNGVLKGRSSPHVPKAQRKTG